MKNPHKLFLAGVLLFSPLTSAARDLTAGSSIKIYENFRFELQTSDVFCWIDGECSGKVRSTKKAMATRLEEKIYSTSKYLDIAMYGVARQNWYLDALSELSPSVRVRAVIDQKKGKLGSTNPSDFNYRDTPELYSILPKVTWFQIS